jgi:hypothetical protein
MSYLFFRGNKYTFNTVPSKDQQERLWLSLSPYERLMLKLFHTIKIHRREIRSAIMKDYTYVIIDNNNIGMVYPQGFYQKLTLNEKLDKRYFA